MEPLRLYYRGRLSGCNYDCGYCPFAKQADSREQLRQDKADLQRFVQWVGQQNQTLEIMFTPWGEAFIRRYYQAAMIHLNQFEQVQKVVIQTNLSGSLSSFLQHANQKIALWCTYHPSQTSLERFVTQCKKLIEHQIRFSVGTVGNLADLEAIEALRSALPASIYVWVNVNRDEQACYTSQDYQRFKQVDPLFELNCHEYASFGKACYAGIQSLFVDGTGRVQRCHFVKQSLGNIYQQFQQDESPCPNQTCDCHIGYLHLKELALYEVFEGGVLERIAASKMRK